MNDGHPVAMSPALLRNLLEDVGREMARQERVAEIVLFGGSALMLMYDFRQSTLDADYMLVSGGEIDVKRAAEAVAMNNGLPEDWLNDAVRIFASDAADVRFLGDFPRKGRTGLRVFHASPEYIFAMKMLAMRSPMETHDVYDAWHLIDRIPVRSMDEAIDLLRDFYPNKKLPVRNEMILRDIFDAKTQGEAYSPALGW